MTLLQRNFVTAKPINFYYLVCKLDRVQYRIDRYSVLASVLYTPLSTLHTKKPASKPVFALLPYFSHKLT